MKIEKDKGLCEKNKFEKTIFFEAFFSIFGFFFSENKKKLSFFLNSKKKNLFFQKEDFLFVFSHGETFSKT